MKSTLIRILTIATLATSISALAAADEPKQPENAKATAAAKQDNCAGDQHKKARKTQKPESEQEKEFDRVLMSIYG